jgi:hypothetical protein
LEKRGISFLCQELNPDTLATQPIAQALYWLSCPISRVNKILMPLNKYDHNVVVVVWCAALCASRQKGGQYGKFVARLYSNQ